MKLKNPHDASFRDIFSDIEKAEDMIISLTMKAILYTFKNIWDFEDIKKIEELILLSKDLFYEESGINIIQKLLLYLYFVNNVESVKVKNIIERLISHEKGEIAMTTAERLIKQGLEQGIEQGVELGIKKGIENGKIDDAKKMLLKGYSILDISEITGLSEEKILALKK